MIEVKKDSETFYTIEVWNTQVGGWDICGEAYDPEAAHNSADKFYHAQMSEHGWARVRIYQHKTQVFCSDNEPAV